MNDLLFQAYLYGILFVGAIFTGYLIVDAIKRMRGK